MSKPFVVKEHDIICCNPAFHSDKFRYMQPSEFQELIGFIHEYTGSAENADALDFMRIGYRRGVGDTVTISNYVGLIQMRSGFQIEVLPKVTLADTNKEVGTDRTRAIFLKMLRSMRDFEGKEFADADLNADRMNLYEVFIHMYLREVQRLVKSGLRSGYECREDNLRYYKGKMLVSDHIRRNIAHKERFYMAFDEFNPNRAENRLIKATLLKLQRLTADDENLRIGRQLLPVFRDVDASVNYAKDFSQIIDDRSTKEYNLLMKWSRIFLTNKSFTTFSGEDSSRALLFPMEKVYESYVYRKLHSLLTPLGWSVKEQDARFYLFESSRTFRLRPDIVLEKGGQVAILDTKWKKLDENAANYGISQTDMYQMYAYSRKYATAECPHPPVWLLYPMPDVPFRKNDISFRSDDGVTVNVYFINLADDRSFHRLHDKL